MNLTGTEITADPGATVPGPSGALWSCDIHVPIQLLPINVMLRKHWAARKKYTAQIAWGIHFALPPSKRPPTPLTKVRIHVERHGAGKPDPDGLRSTIKPVLDVLQSRSRRHPYGLDVLVDDTEAVVGEPQVQAIKCARGVYFFRLRVWDVSDLP